MWVAYINLNDLIMKIEVGKFATRCSFKVLVQYEKETDFWADNSASKAERLKEGAE
jgi:arabinogalactan endo-1,4-beta-galactosidase